MSNARSTFTFELQPMETEPGNGVRGQSIYVHEGSFAIVKGTNDKAAGWIDTHALFAGRLYTHHVLPTAEPTADDAERARELVRAGVRCIKLCTDADCECAQQGAVAFASIRASQAAEVAALKGELLAVREALENIRFGREPHPHRIAARALTSSAPLAAAIEREIRADERAACKRAVGSIVSMDAGPERQLAAIDCLGAIDRSAAIRAANATGETNG